MEKLINFIDQINWHEVGQAIVKAIAFTYTLGYCLGLWVHRTNAQLSAAHVAALGLKPTATTEQSPTVEQEELAPMAFIHPLAELAVELEQLANQQLQELAGTRKRLSKYQLIGACLRVT